MNPKFSMRFLFTIVFSFLSILVYCHVVNYSSTDTVEIVDTAPISFLQLRITNDSVSKNDILNEEIVDMVHVNERDKKVPTRYTTHQGGTFGWFIRMIGFYWHAIDRERHKFVGTNKNGLSLPGKKDELTEHDVNFNLIPHLPQYLDLSFAGRQAQMKRRQFRRARHDDRTRPPYIAPSIETATAYDLHCELTPPKKMRDSVNALVYPCMYGYNLDNHCNFYDMKPTVGLYGVFVLDCNHACHPEIHPYEWLWWLRLTDTEKAESNFSKSWMIGFFKESSNRFILWSQSPRVGTISIPFIFKTSETKSYLKLNQLVSGKFKPAGIKRMKDLPEYTQPFTTDTTVILNLGEGEIFPLQLLTSKVTKTPALRWWLSDIQTDRTKEWIWGRFNMVVSVKDGYTARFESVTNK